MLWEITIYKHNRWQQKLPYFFCFFPQQLWEQSTSILWQGREYTNICHQKYAAIKGKSLCVTASNQWQRQARAESREGVCNSTDANTWFFLQIRSYWRVTKPRCSSTREHLTCLLLSSGPDTGGERGPTQLLRRAMLQQTHQGLHKHCPPQGCITELIHSQEPANINNTAQYSQTGSTSSTPYSVRKITCWSDRLIN